MIAQNDIDYRELEFKILEESDDLSSFDCSKDDNMGLNEFIHDQALQYQHENLGITYLFFHEKRIVGFVTIAMSQIEVKLTTFKLPFTCTITNHPALLIGRLAVDNDYRDADIGTNLCLWCLHMAKKLSNEVGCRFVVVLTEGKPVCFYQKCNFEIPEKYKSKKRVFLYQKIP